MVTVQPRSIKQSTQIVLEGVSWQTYQALLKDLGNNRASLLAYDQGTLEITMPSELHEIINRLLDRIVTALTEELDMKIKSYGSTTLDREDLARGVEPDSCYFIRNVEQLRARRLDLRTVPPPDLVIEVDITSSSRRRFGIYLQLRIPEVWRYTEQTGVIIYQLQGNEYVECDSSIFTMVTGARLMEFLKLAETVDDDNQVIRELRRWVRSQDT